LLFPMAFLGDHSAGKYTLFHSRPHSGSRGSSGMLRSRSPVSAPLEWLHRAFSSSAVVPLSESPSRELRMRSATKARRGSEASKKHKKSHHVSKKWW